MNPEDGFSLQELSSDSKLTRENPEEMAGKGTCDNTDGLIPKKSPSKGQIFGATPVPPGYYPIRSRGQRGLGVVLCNISFSHPLRHRKAAAADKENLCLLFERMGLKVSAHIDLTGAQMRDTIQHYSRLDHSASDCFLMAVSTHGERGRLLGTDGDSVAIESCLLSSFNGAHCSSLRGKPKVFFIQACRGAEKDFCVEIPSSSADCPENGNGNGATAERGRGLMEVIRKFFSSPSTSESAPLPVELDFFVCYSTVPGYVSWRSSLKGSWFLFALYECYIAYGSEVHLADLMTYVTDYVTKCFSEVDAETHRVVKQVICFESRLSKFLRIPLNRIE